MALSSDDIDQVGKDQISVDPPPPYTFALDEKHNADVSNTERLRRFLSRLLAKEYVQGFCGSDKFRKDDWLYFTHLSKLCFEGYIRKHPRSGCILLDWTDDDCDHAEVEHYLWQPARALGVPTGELLSLSSS